VAWGSRKVRLRSAAKNAATADQRHAENGGGFGVDVL
jgi:hypothetical protein